MIRESHVNEGKTMTNPLPVKTFSDPNKLATNKQRALLATLGHQGAGEALTIAQASELIEALKTERKEQTGAIVEAAKRQAEQINLIELAERYTELRKESSKEMSGACPKCGGSKRFHVTAAWFFCRDCHPERGDAIEFLQWLEGCSFLEACARLTGGALPVAPTVRAPAPKAKQADKQPANWEKSARAKLEAAQALLWDDTAGAVAHAYLEKRGLLSHTWLAYGLGFDPAVGLPGTYDNESKQRSHPVQPAIVIPWLADAGKRLVAVRYRFLQEHTYKDTEGNERKAKQTALYGSDFEKRLFGGQALPDFVFLPAAERCAEQHRTLVLCEGEINAMSIWQACQHTRLDVVSIGSETATLPAKFGENFAAHYGQVITWLDKPDLATKVALSLPGAHAINSPQGKDANDLLQAGLLGAYLATVRLLLCKDDSARQALLWALYDATMDWQGIDAGSAQVMQKIATGLGLQVSLAEVEPGRWVSEKAAAIKQNAGG